MDKLVQALIRPSNLLVLSFLAYLRFANPVFSGKSGRGASALAGLPSRVRTVRNEDSTVLGFVTAILIAIFGILCLRDEIALSISFGHNDNTPFYFQPFNMKMMKTINASLCQGWFLQI